jgi:hypothetical protein
MINPIKGIVSVTANYGVGKTEFCLSCGVQPEEIVYINDDGKETGLEDQFGQFFSFIRETKGMKQLELHQHGLDLIERIKSNRVIIWDTWTRFELSFITYGRVNPNKLRNQDEWSRLAAIKGSEMMKEALNYEVSILNSLKGKCDILFITCHLKPNYINGVEIAGKSKPEHNNAVQKAANLRLWLTPNARSQSPTGLVMKNISKREITERGIRPTQVLPLRLERCDWDNILTYWDNPIGDRETVEGEQPNSFELSLIEDTLTAEDKRLYEASLPVVERRAEQAKTDELLAKQEQVRAIKKYAAENLNGLPSPVQLSKIKAEIEAGNLAYDGEITASILR